MRVVCPSYVIARVCWCRSCRMGMPMSMQLRTFDPFVQPCTRVQWCVHTHIVSCILHCIALHCIVHLCYRLCCILLVQHMFNGANTLLCWMLCCVPFHSNPWNCIVFHPRTCVQWCLHIVIVDSPRDPSIQSSPIQSTCSTTVYIHLKCCFDAHCIDSLVFIELYGHPPSPW